MVDFYDVSPPENDPSPCENCGYYDLVGGCSEGHEPESCPHLKHVMSDDWKYDRRVDEGEGL